MLATALVSLLGWTELSHWTTTCLQTNGICWCLFRSTFYESSLLMVIFLKIEWIRHLLDAQIIWKGDLVVLCRPSASSIRIFAPPYWYRIVNRSLLLLAIPQTNIIGVRHNFLYLSHAVVLFLLQGSWFCVWVIAHRICLSHLVASTETWLKSIDDLIIVIIKALNVIVDVRRLDSMGNSRRPDIRTRYLCAMSIAKVSLTIHGPHLYWLLEIKVCQVHRNICLSAHHIRAWVSDLSIWVDSLWLKRILLSIIIM